MSHSGKGAVTSRLISRSYSQHCLEWRILKTVLMMHFEAVLVSFRVQGYDETYKTSGILFNTNIVLITGTSLIPLVKREGWMSLFIKSCSAELRANEYLKNLSFCVHVKCERNNKSEDVSDKIYELRSKPFGVWKCPLVSESVKNLLYEWTLGCMTINLSNDDIHMSKELISVFILLKCESKKSLKLNENDDDTHALLNFMLSLKKPKRGEEVGILSSPFGSKHFMNSLSRGIISNVMGCRKCIILSDARTVSGCEGGPIFSVQKSWKQEEKRVLMGVVAGPFSWWRGEWVGLTLGINLAPVLKRLFIKDDKTCWEDLENTLSNCSSDLSTVNLIDQTVVLIRSNTSWGAGVILHAVSGVIITCSHVVKDNNTVSVFQKGNCYSADVVFKSRDDIAYDLAVVKVKKNSVFTNEANFSVNSAKVGDIVTAAGFPFFSERDDAQIRPSIATGCVARVNPYMIQTTCCIQSGFSGGALFRDKKLLGLVVSNVKDSTAGALFPHINFIIPSSVFKEPLLKYIRTNNSTYLKNLESSDVKVQALWKLQTSKL